MNAIDKIMHMTAEAKMQLDLANSPSEAIDVLLKWYDDDEVAANWDSPIVTDLINTIVDAL